MRILTAVSASRGLSVASEGVDTITLGNSSQDNVIANAPITASGGISGSIGYFDTLYVDGIEITSSQAGGGGGISTVYTSGNIINSGSSGDPITLKNQISLQSITASSNIDVSGGLFQYIDLKSIAAAPAYSSGRLYRDPTTADITFGTDVNNVLLSVGQQTIIKGRNNTGAALTKGKFVRINGGLGDRPTFTTASWVAETISKNTLGVVMETINNGADGFVLVNGIITGITGLNTTQYTEGDLLYLSSSGDFTNVKPVRPNHEVRLGEVVRTNNGASGAMFVSVVNGFELDELHNVSVANSSSGDLLIYDSTTDLWSNKKQLTGSYALTGNLNVTNSITASYFTGSYYGNGANITNIATSNIVDLYNYTSGTSASIDTNVVALWRFNESTSGSNAVSDVSSSYFNLALYGTSITASGKFNNTRYLSNSGLFQRTGSEEIGILLNNDWTLDGWLKTTDSHVSSSYIFWYAGLNYETDITHNPLAAIEISDENKIIVNAWKDVGIETNATRTQIKTEVLPKNSWNHFAVTRTLVSASDGISTGSLSNYRIYVNGVLQNETNSVSGTVEYISGTVVTHYLSVGNKIAVSLGTSSNNVYGYLDDLRLSDVARTDTEIKNLYFSSFSTVNGLIKSGSQFTDNGNNLYYNKGNLTIGGEDGIHKLSVYGSTYVEDLHLSGNATIGEDTSDTLTINSSFTANAPAIFDSDVTIRGTSFVVTSSTINFNTAIITASIITASNIYAANELYIYGNTIQGGVLELTESFNFNDLITFTSSSATFVNAVTTSIRNGFFTGSFNGNGYALTSLTASNISNFTSDVRSKFSGGSNITIVSGVISASVGPYSGTFGGDGSNLYSLTASKISNFTNDVRAQFVAGDNITIVNGAISSSGGGGGISAVSSSGNITGSGLSGNEIRLKDNITLTSISASTITSSNFYIDQNSLITGEIIQTDYLDAITITASVITASNFYIDQNTLITGEIIQSDAVEINTYLQLAANDPLPSGSLGRLAVSGTILYFHNGTSWVSVT